ncbi:TonB-dependent receptor [uncultured Parasphingopyxis sp.]|uniref:TonB-dependent receptor n=1 Tax=uncultured Parasphingopyxis sp. TaxID=1547918 RepID=UPI002626985A|nr:TonB-dependent receptor [uncultured Parasphingopyxis sp.]
MRIATLALASTALWTAPLAAQSTAGSSPQSADALHRDSEAQIVVTAPFGRRLDILAGTSVLQGPELTNNLRPQIGDVLADLPGVSATSFSPGASRPVLRGLQGERVRVLTDGIGAIDASNTSVDHAVTIDPITAQRIEVLRGPAALLYGSQAIGGAVNVIDRRIPREVPDEAIHIDAVGIYGSAAEERSIAGGIDVPLTNRLVLHVDGSYRETDDLEVGGFVLTSELRAEQLEIAAEETEEGHLEEAEEALELANLSGGLPNSATETYTAGAGLAFIDERGSLGVSVGYFDSNYGVPSRPGAEHHHGEEEGEDHDDEDHEDEEGHEHGEEPVTIGLQSFRADIRGEILTGGGFLESIRVRLGFSDYEHTEFEGDEVGTVFLVEGFEGRVELVQAERNGWNGVIGGQLFVRDFNAIGAEAFVPRNDTQQMGLFTLQEFDLGGFSVEAAARYEHTNVDAPPLGISRDFDAFSAAIGANADITDGVTIGANLSRSERAPSAEELYSNGPHIATQAFEVGNPNFDTEKSIGAEIYLRGSTGPFTFGLTGYANWFNDYIYETDTGLEEDELPVFQYFQQNATFYGFEAEASVVLAESAGWRFIADGVADYVHADLDDTDQPVPRIPPFRVLGGLEAQSDQFTARAEVEWVAEQDRVTSFETPTDDFTLVNASLTWRPWGRANGTAIIASVNNIFNVDARRHASFTKDFVPLPGRDFRLSARFSF